MVEVNVYYAKENTPLIAGQLLTMLTLLQKVLGSTNGQIFK